LEGAPPLLSDDCTAVSLTKSLFSTQSLAKFESRSKEEKKGELES
jgi:hypothetical protein